MSPADWSPVDLVPGLWTALLGVLLLRALRRWYDPVPALVAGAFGLVLLILFGPVLFGGKLLLPLDNLRGQAPFTELAPTEPPGNSLQGDLIELVGPSISEGRAVWAAGRWPLWNGKVGAGMPLLADPQTQALQPLVLVSSFLPWMRAAAVTAALRVFLALVFTFLWMRTQGLGSGPALAGAFAFGLGGFMLLWVGWPLANSAALLPAVLYALARCRRHGGRRDFLLLALAALALLLGGHPETVFASFGVALAVLVVQTIDATDGSPASLRLRRLRGSILALVLAGLAAAPALLPTAAYLPQTLRATRIRNGEVTAPVPAASRSEDLARRLLPIAAPNAYGNSRFGAYWGLSNTNEDASGFIGTAALLAAVLSLGVRRRFPLERLALSGAVLCLTVLATPSGIGRRLLLILSLALAFLAACALERFKQGDRTRWRIWSVLLAAALLAAVIVWGILAHPNPAGAGSLAVLRFGWLRWQMRFLGLAALLLVAGYGKRWMPPAVAGLIAAELLLAHLPANPPMPKRLAFPMTPAIRFLQDNTRRTRMAALGRAFPPNLAGAYGLSDARVYSPMAPRAYLDWLAPAVTGWSGESPELGAPRQPLYRRLGVRYLLTEPAAQLPPPLRRAFADSSAAVWEVPGPLPRIFIEQGVAPGTGRMRLQSLAAGHLQAQASLSREAVVETSIYQDGGWRMLRNGVRCPPAPADGPFVAARLPAGAWQVDLIYRPAAFVWGCLLAALALAAGAAVFIAPPPTAPTAAPLPEAP